MLNLPARFTRWLTKSSVAIAAIVEIVTSYLIGRLDTKEEWEAATTVDQSIATTLSADLTDVATSMTVTSTDGFTIPISSTWPAYLILNDGVNSEVVKYTGGTNTTFTGLTRAQYGTTAHAFLAATPTNVIQLLLSSGSAPTYDFQIQPKNWTQPTVAGAVPSARIGAACAWDNVNNVLWVHGGYDGAAYLNDLWYFDPAANTWTQNTYTGGPPTARAYHTMVFAPDVSNSPYLYVCGGQTAAASYTTDHYRFLVNLAACAYATRTAIPTTRVDHVAALAPKGTISANSAMMYIFGGETTTASNRHICYKYTASNDTWATIASIPDLSTAYVAFKGKAVWCATQQTIFMTFAIAGIMTVSILIYDPAANTWEKSYVGGLPATRTPMPSPQRVYTNAAYDTMSSKVLVFGGRTDAGGGIVYSDLWQYNIEADQWIQIASYREGRSRCVMDWDTVKKRAIIWGGSKATSSALTAPTYPAPAYFEYYWGNVGSEFQTKYKIDLGSIPTTNGAWELDFTQPGYLSGHAITFSAEWSDDASAYTSIGAIKDGDAITALHRYYRVAINVSSDVDGTPAVQKIEAKFDVVSKLSLANKAVFSYPPVVKGLPNLGWSIDPLKGVSKTSALSIELVDDEGHTVRNLVKNNTVYNKRVRVKLGFYDPNIQASYDVLFSAADTTLWNDLDLYYPEADYIPYYAGHIKDYSWDGRVLKLDIQDTLSLLYDKEIPVDVDGGQPAAITYSTAGITQPVSIMLDILQNKINWPDRNLDLNSFNSVKNDASISAWKFYRVLSKPTKVKALLEEICRLIGASLIPGEDGRLRLKLYSTTEAAAATITERDMIKDSAEMEWNPDSVKNFIAVYYSLISGDGTKVDDYTAAQGRTDADSITRFDETWVERVFSKWLGTVATYAGDVRADDIAARILARTAFGVPKYGFKTDLSFFAVQVGDIVQIKMALMDENDKLIEAQTRLLPELPSPPYLTLGADKCVDMKMQVVKKSVNLKDKTIDWDLWRAKYVLDVDIDTQAQFEANGYGQDIDTATTPGSVQLDPSVNSGWYQATFSMGQQPEEDGAWTLTKTTPGSTTVTFEAWASDTGLWQGEETYIGTIVTGGSITVKKRYYKVKATLTGTAGPWVTPTLDRIRAYFNG